MNRRFSKTVPGTWSSARTDLSTGRDAISCLRIVLMICSGNLNYRGFKVNVLDGVINCRRYVLKPYPCGLAKNLILKPITAGSGRGRQFKWF